MKVGNVTIVGYSNYGNRLQNYAVNYFMKSMGASVDTLDLFILEEYDLKGFSGLKRIMEYLLPDPLCGAGYRLYAMTGLERLRYKRFKKFTDRYIRLRRLKYRSVRQAERRLGKRYGLFVTGSDQVWNPAFAGKQHLFLTFAPPEKRVAFSASIGVAGLSVDNKEKYRRWLQEMRFISVREGSAADLVEGLTGSRPEVWPDPTLLLDRAVWRKLARRPETELPERYILSFFLGEEPAEMLAGYESVLKLPVIHLENRDFPQYYTVDPAEFLYLIEHAGLVLTDSFHGTVFSVKFHVPFFVFRRQQKGGRNMFTRIEHLLERFRLESRYRERSWQEEYGTWEEITEIQYGEIEAQTAAERQRIEKTLRDMMEHVSNTL